MIEGITGWILDVLTLGLLACHKTFVHSGIIGYMQELKAKCTCNLVVEGVGIPTAIYACWNHSVVFQLATHFPAGMCRTRT